MFKASNLSSLNFPEPKEIIPGLVTEGITLLSGNPKIGKSWMVLGMGTAVATGGVLFGNIPCPQHSVLYLSLEDTEARLKSRLMKMMGWEPIPDGLYYELEFPRFPLAAKMLDNCLSANPDIRLVMIDTLEKIRPPRRSNSYEDDYRALESLRPLANKHHVAFVVVHHNRKSGSGAGTEEVDVIERVSGTQGLTGSVDTILVLTRQRGTDLACMDVVSRDLPEQQLSLKLDSTFGLWCRQDANAV